MWLFCTDIFAEPAEFEEEVTDAPAEDELDETAGGFLVCPVVLAALPYGSSPQEGAVSCY